MIRPLPDFGLIHGETVAVRTPSVSYDEHMEEVVSWSEESVPNVVVTPGSTSNVVESARPDGSRTVYTLGFPKAFSASLRGCRVVVRGTEYAVVGDPQPLTPDNVPGPWNYTAEVEAVDG